MGIIARQDEIIYYVGICDSHYNQSVRMCGGKLSISAAL
jgi:hypothetical protein